MPWKQSVVNEQVHSAAPIPPGACRRRDTLECVRAALRVLTVKHVRTLDVVWGMFPHAKSATEALNMLRNSCLMRAHEVPHEEFIEAVARGVRDRKRAPRKQAPTFNVDMTTAVDI